MAQALGCRSDLRRDNRKKRVVAESATEALSAWNEANEVEKCVREDSFVGMYAVIGDKTAQDALRTKHPNEHHCRWLQRDPNACDALPSGIDGIEAGVACPHNVYHQQAELFANRDAASETVERLFRLIGSAEAGLLQGGLDILSTTELLAAKSELNRQESDRMKRARETPSDRE